MSAAIIRKCNACQTKIILSEACNEMTCSACRTRQCYVCRETLNGNTSHQWAVSGGVSGCRRYPEVSHDAQRIRERTSARERAIMEWCESHQRVLIEDLDLDHVILEQEEGQAPEFNDTANLLTRLDELDQARWRRKRVSSDWGPDHRWSSSNHHNYYNSVDQIEFSASEREKLFAARQEWVQRRERELRDRTDAKEKGLNERHQLLQGRESTVQQRERSQQGRETRLREQEVRQSQKERTLDADIRRIEERERRLRADETTLQEGKGRNEVEDRRLRAQQISLEATAQDLEKQKNDLNEAKLRFTLEKAEADATNRDKVEELEVLLNVLEKKSIALRKAEAQADQNLRENQKEKRRLEQRAEETELSEQGLVERTKREVEFQKKLREERETWVMSVNDIKVTLDTLKTQVMEERDMLEAVKSRRRHVENLEQHWKEAIQFRNISRWVLRGLQNIFSTIILCLMVALIATAPLEQSPSVSIHYCLSIAALSIATWYYTWFIQYSSTAYVYSRSIIYIDAFNALCYLAGGLVLVVQLGTSGCQDFPSVSRRGFRAESSRCHLAQASSAFMWLGKLSHFLGVTGRVCFIFDDYCFDVAFEVDGKTKGCSVVERIER
jgi:hypothetical protein